MNKLSWDALLHDERRKTRAEEGESTNTEKGRVQLERDYDRILFATPTRRLADKTQVFPLEKNDSVRTRLTHSHEVANLARSIGVRIAFDHADDVFGGNAGDWQVQRTVPALLAAIGLSHDLGNPPFGHQGEEAIKAWFRERHEEEGGALQDKIHPDFLSFDGNAQSFRLLARLQTLNDDFGLNLTDATLASLMKYPSFHNTDDNAYDKWGIFESEREIAEEVWKFTGLEEGQRHPLTYIMEACDDIAYSVIDAEDTVKKGYASFYDLMDYLKHHSEGDEVIDGVLASSWAKNVKFKESEELSSPELIDMSMQMFRVFAIFQMVDSATEAFVAHVPRMMAGTIDPGFKLIKHARAAKLCKTLKDFNKKHGFRNKDVLRLELQGNNYIQSMMDMLWSAIVKDTDNEAFNKYGYRRISENYRRVYEAATADIEDRQKTLDEANEGLPKDSWQSLSQADQTGLLYAQCQLLCDAVSGMTDSYLISLHEELRPLYDGYRR